MCVFCDIAEGRSPAEIVLDDERVLAFLDSRPLFPGHTLVIPRRHIETLPDLEGSEIAPLFQTVQLLAAAIPEALAAAGSFVAINNKVSQSVPHLHVHVVPRNPKDGLKGFFWPRHRYRDQDHVLEVGAGIREAVERLR